MQIPFEVGDREVMFHWHSTLNKAEIEVGPEIRPLNRWWSPRQQFSIKRTRRWSTEVDGHRIEVEKVKPGLIGIGRANEVSVFVDGEFAAREIGT